MKPYINVTIVKSPITTRYIEPGSQGLLDTETNRVRVGGVWFDLRPKVWKVVTEEQKKPEFLNDLFKEYDYLRDQQLIELVEAYAITEEQAMEWMVETKRFTRLEMNNAWIIEPE